ncbi:ABC transporter ATP-binding protein [Eubacterium aggregans]|uniref:ABC transporter ATP-binding protein n=1 Tax=Eubacterium aggregans TaxID=81409 RepID=UPI0023F01858|nr:ABC transporter ATP-binding protein [Eubacterium aggregans]MDD4691429.1 ABC transporter ATP-binding protein [Eubacterium aggregans]
MGYLQGRYKWRFAVVLVLIILSALASVAGSLFIGNVIDDYITPMLTQAVPNFAPLLRAIGVMAGIYLIGVLSTLFYNRVMVTIAQNILKDIRDEMFKWMQRLPISYFDTHSHGDIMSHYTNDTDTLRQMMSQSIPQTFSSLITIVSVFFAMLFTSWPLTILVLVTIYLMIMLSGKIAGASSRYFVRQQDSIGVVNGYIEEMMHGQKVVKVFCHEEASKEGFDARNEDLFENASAANTYANILMPIMANCGNLQYVLVAIVGAVLMLNGITPLTLGGLVAFLTLTKNFSMPVSQISQQLNAIIMALAGAKRIFTLMDEAPEEDEGYVTLVNVSRRDGELVEADRRTGLWAWKHPHKADGSVTYHELKGEVRFYHVDFEYVVNKPILQDITLYAEPGQKLALVGATGAGKTTITNLINRFYDIADGKIRYDGININKIKKPDLRRSLGIVLQDTNLFTGTVMENIRYGNLSASDDEVMAAARLANADDFIRRLPQGYETLLDSEGGSLSQGQCQLISIARAAVADPPVMILDEATSSIDTRTEALVQAGMDSLMIGRTVFVIAHRLSTIKNADAIMVMEQGRIIERGNHDALMDEHGEYYQLYTGGLELE